MRFRRSLPLVSKSWWKPATRGLYKHIVIRRLQQIPYLARTLTSKDAGIDFGALVRKITLFRCIVVLPLWNVSAPSLQAVFQRCAALEELAFHRDPDCIDTFTEGADIFSDLVACVGHNPLWVFPKAVFPALRARAHAPNALRKLDLGSFEAPWNDPDWDLDNDVWNMYIAIHRLMLKSPRLTSLAIQNYYALPDRLPSMPHLEELYLDFRDFAPKPSSGAIWMWDLPRLRSLTVAVNELPTVALEELGRSLVYLHVSSSTPCTGAGFAQLPQLCPLLEHFIFYPQVHTPEGICALFDLGEPLHNLRHLDVWLRSVADTQAWTPGDASSLLAHMRARAAPALESARGLLAVTPLPRDLPVICHPSLLTQDGADGTGTRFACVRDVWMAQTAWAVQPLGDWWLDEGMWLGPDPDAESEGDMSNRGEESESGPEGWGWLSESDDEPQQRRKRIVRRAQRGV
uniref:Uncharacterized protein n=1 Tax=Ganoderma boninense TaxID=34458 RepID=A0A5K1K6W3_9APHY|nr:Uncharacterized protein [Ganoderma boninense]